MAFCILPATIFRGDCSFRNVVDAGATAIIVALLLTNEKIGWSHRGRMNHHGGVTLVEDDEWGKMYKTFGLSAPVPGVDNCVVVHEGNLALPIGFGLPRRSELGRCEIGRVRVRAGGREIRETREGRKCVSS